MRVYTYKKTIVDIRHFRFCSKHYQLLLTLQREMPNMLLESAAADGQKFIPIHTLNLEDQIAIRDLNPNEM